MIAPASVRSAMAEYSGEGGLEAAPLAMSGSFKEGKSSSSSRRRVPSRRPSLDADEFMNLLHGSDPVKLELNRLENEVKGVKMWFDLKSFSLDFFLLRVVDLLLTVVACVSVWLQIRTENYLKLRRRSKP